jgi:hypothetical protein
VATLKNKPALKNGKILIDRGPVLGEPYTSTYQCGGKMRYIFAKLEQKIKVFAFHTLTASRYIWSTNLIANLCF